MQHYSTPLVRELIHSLKFEGLQEAVPTLATLTVATMKTFGLPPAWHAVAKSDWSLVPIPLPPMRHRMRGYNQSELLARAISTPLGLTVENIIVRHGLQQPQSDLKDKNKRHDNVKGVFSVRPNASIQRKVFVLVDDVYTSGATMEECAKALKRAGAKEVWGLAMAKG